MTLPTYPNPLTSLDITTEFQGPSTNIDLNSYHGGSGYVPSGTVGYLNGFLNKLAREIPEVREAIELRIKQRSRDNYTY
jgi:hypothetical protein